jgi:hypothetical protein
LLVISTVDPSIEQQQQQGRTGLALLATISPASFFPFKLFPFFTTSTRSGCLVRCTFGWEGRALIKEKMLLVVVVVVVVFDWAGEIQKFPSVTYI